MTPALERLTWYVRRLRAMSPAEVATRAQRTLEHRADAASFHVARPLWRARWEPSVGTFLQSASPGVPRGFLRRDRASDVRSALSAHAAALTAHADGIMQGKARFFGYPEVPVEDAWRETLDPFTGRRWPARHAKRIDYRHGGAGDPKWMWELHRCQHLPPLAAAWLLTGEARYAEHAVQLLLSWIDAHPPGRGIAWSSGFEAGLRAISLATTIDGLRGSEFLSSRDSERALRALWQHGRWIERDPSTGSSANNHRIGELVGLVVIGSLVPELHDARRWLDVGVAELGREADRQIRVDGTSVEQAFSYHVFVVDMLLVATAALDCAGHPVPDSVAAAIERSGDALWAQLGADEPAPTYGDTDDGRAIVLDDGGLRDPRAAAAAVAARFGHARCARVAKELDANAWWLFGREGADRFAQLERAPEPASVLLPQARLAVLRSGDRRILFDCGPHGHLSIAAHAHADALAVEISLGAANLVVDPGVGSYFAQPVVREAFRGTGFHATVTVDETSSSEPGGPFLWTRHAETRLLTVDLEQGFVVGRHDGYTRLQDPVLHTRAVVSLGDSLLVVDRLETSGAHVYSQRWPLHPRLELEEQRDDRVVARDDRSGVALAVAASHPLTLTVARGSRKPLLGWWSPRLESSTPAWLVAADVASVGTVEIAALVVPFESESPADGALAFTTLDGRTRVEATAFRTQHVIELDLASPAVEVKRLTPSAGVA